MMWVGMIAFWGVVIWLGYIFLRAATRDTSKPQDENSATQILNERLARGEIDVDEYGKFRDAMVNASRDKAATGSPR
jgi:uncharacterized membrane protein